VRFDLRLLCPTNEATALEHTVNGEFLGALHRGVQQGVPEGEERGRRG